jgi:hypothetical protein
MSPHESEVIVSVHKVVVENFIVSPSGTSSHSCTIEHTWVKATKNNKVPFFQSKQ